MNQSPHIEKGIHMTRRFLVVFIGLSLTFFFCHYAEALNKSNLPDYMNRLVFKNRKFTKPITFCFSYEDSKKLLNEIRTTKYGLEPVFYTKGYNGIDKDVLSYLIMNKFAYLEWAKVNAGYGPGNEHNFLFFILVNSRI